MPTSLKAAAAGDLGRELALTRKVLTRLPDDRLAWRPHDKSMTLGGLATHVANIPYWMLGTLQTDGFDLSDAPRPQAELTSLDAILETFDRNVQAVEEAFDATDDAAMAATWTLRRGEHTLSAQPRAVMLRTWGISHLVHHRGQLSVYLRLLDVPVPSIYGPSADEAPAFG